MAHSAFIGVIVSSVSGRHKNLCLEVGTSIDQVHQPCMPACLSCLVPLPNTYTADVFFYKSIYFFRYLYPNPICSWCLLKKHPP